ncbi:unnamed protein product, partial [Effrenium voratum]
MVLSATQRVVEVASLAEYRRHVASVLGYKIEILLPVDGSQWEGVTVWAVKDHVFYALMLLEDEAPNTPFADWKKCSELRLPVQSSDEHLMCFNGGCALAEYDEDTELHLCVVDGEPCLSVPVSVWQVASVQYRGLGSGAGSKWVDGSEAFCRLHQSLTFPQLARPLVATDVVPLARGVPAMPVRSERGESSGVPASSVSSGSEETDSEEEDCWEGANGEWWDTYTVHIHDEYLAGGDAGVKRLLSALASSDFGTDFYGEPDYE